MNYHVIKLTPMHTATQFILFALDKPFKVSLVKIASMTYSMGNTFRKTCKNINRSEYKNNTIHVQYAYHDTPTFSSWLHVLHHSIDHSI